MSNFPKIAVANYTVTTALGHGVRANLAKLLQGQTGLAPCIFKDASDIGTYAGEVEHVDEVKLPSATSTFDCRNNRLAALAIDQDNFRTAVQDRIHRYGQHRVGVMIGTSTSGTGETERAYRHAFSNDGRLPSDFHYPHTQNIFSISDFVSSILGTSGLCMAVSTACSSSAKVFASAARGLNAGIFDAVVVGGVDSLCLTTLFGFRSLQLTSPDICRPCDIDRDGISIGEAAGFALLERNCDDARSFLVGYGESSDAHHMSSPHPEGKGALLAMSAALEKAYMSPNEIGYINLHGTGTRANDSSECNAISNLFGTKVACSSTKGFTGHTLGACGIVESVFSMLAIENGFLPENLNLRRIDGDISANIVTKTSLNTLQFAMTNAFGFGGTNCSLIFGGLT